MGKKSNVNPDHYKTAGRDPQGQSVLQEVQRRKYKEAQAQLSRDTAGPVAAPGKKKAAPKRRVKTPKARIPKPVTENMDQNLQGSDKRGKRSMAQKRAGSRHGLNPHPPPGPSPEPMGSARQPPRYSRYVRRTTVRSDRSRPRKDTAAKRT
jgi:hypothetical protein